MIVFAPRFAAIACAISKVPFAQALISNTPIGPFQMTVFARAISSLNSFTLSGPMSTPSQPSGMFSPGTVRRVLPIVFASKSNASVISASTGISSFTPRAFALSSAACAMGSHSGL